MVASYESFFAGKRITMLGLGLLGRGVGDAEFIAPLCRELLITDRKTEHELQASVDELKKFSNVTFRLGKQREEDFINCDMVIKAAGVPLDSPYIAAAKKAGIPVYMSTALFAKFAQEMGATIIGVTGTRGKSTVAHMLHYVLIRANKHTVLGGNIRGISTLAMLPQVKKSDITVLELDSWQLQGFGDMKLSPHIAIFTNFMPDHQNYYRDMSQYFEDKANIFKFQKKDDVLIVGAAALEKVKAARPKVAPQVPEAIPVEWKLRIPGEHNRAHASLVAAALRALHISESDIRAGIESFVGVEGRLQFVQKVRGVKIYNDNNATTPEATIAALQALGTKRNIVLILGGSDKGLDMGALISLIGQRCKAACLLAGTGTDRIRTQLLAPVFGSLNEALHAALDAAVPDDVILFSPAFASFGMFKNEYERNDCFLDAVERL